MNPRVLSWLRATGLTVADIARRADGDSARLVMPDGACLPWSIPWREWLRARWCEWASEKGFRGDYAHEKAQLAGHHDFDTWLEARYPQ